MLLVEVFVVLVKDIELNEEVDFVQGTAAEILVVIQGMLQ